MTTDSKILSVDPPKLAVYQIRYAGHEGTKIIVASSINEAVEAFTNQTGAYGTIEAVHSLGSVDRVSIQSVEKIIASTALIDPALVYHAGEKGAIQKKIKFAQYAHYHNPNELGCAEKLVEVRNKNSSEPSKSFYADKPISPGTLLITIGLPSVQGDAIVALDDGNGEVWVVKSDGPVSGGSVDYERGEINLTWNPQHVVDKDELIFAVFIPKNDQVKI